MLRLMYHRKPVTNKEGSPSDDKVQVKKPSKRQMFVGGVQNQFKLVN